MHFDVSIETWSARAGSLKTRGEIRRWLRDPVALEPRIAPESIAGVSPMALRRTSRLGCAAIAIGRELLEDVPAGQALSVVTVSELGELGTNDALIENVVAGEPLSPQRFSVSVHNHVLGQLCITLGLELPGGASTGAASGLEVGMIEALSELATGRWVLLLAFEPEVDQHYAPWIGGTAPEYMVGVLLRPDAGIRLALDRPGHRRSPETTAAALHSLRWLSLVDGIVREFDGADGWRWRHVAG